MAALLLRAAPWTGICKSQLTRVSQWAKTREELLLRAGHTNGRCLSLSLSLGPLTVWRLVLRFPGCWGLQGDWPGLGGYREGLGQ